MSLRGFAKRNRFQTLYRGVSICGDFNSLTAETRNINLDTNFPEHVQFSETRLNVDKIINTYGRKWIDLCVNNDMVILNSRARCNGTNKNSSYTCIRHNGSSVVDYVITQLDFFKTVRYFKVLEKLVESDHTPLAITLNIKLAKQRANQDTKYDVPFRYIWNLDNKQMFLESVNAIVKQGIYQEILCEVDDQHSKSDNIVDLFYSMMLTAMHGKFKKIGNKFKIDCLIINGLTKIASN